MSRMGGGGERVRGEATRKRGRSLHRHPGESAAVLGEVESRARVQDLSQEPVRAASSMRSLGSVDTLCSNSESP